MSSVRKKSKELSDLGRWLMQYIPRHIKIGDFSDAIGWSTGAVDNLRLKQRGVSPRLDLMIDIITYISQRDNIHPDELALEMLRSEINYKRALKQWELKNAKKEKDR
jgi:hypothetical protein